MGIFSRSSEPSKGDVSTDGQGGFANLSGDGVTASTGGDPVDNLINLASQLADQDDQS